MQQFLAMFSSHPKFSSISTMNHQYLFEDLTYSEDRKKEKDSERKKRKYQDRFFGLLESVYGTKFNINSKWQDVVGELAGHTAFQKLDEASREHCFNLFIQHKKVNSSQIFFR